MNEKMYSLKDLVDFGNYMLNKPEKSPVSDADVSNFNLDRKSEINFLTNLAKEVYENNKKKGFWDCKTNVGEKLMLVVSELGEAIEAHRTNKIGYENLYYNVYTNEYPNKNTFQDELADAIIRLLDLSGGLGIDISHFVKEKLKYNKNRPQKHGMLY